jgi:hypothetical protein
MAGRGSSPGRSARLGDIQEILAKLKAEVADLRGQVEAAGSTYFSKFESQLQVYEDSTLLLEQTLKDVTSFVKERNGDAIPDITLGRHKYPGSYADSAHFSDTINQSYLEGVTEDDIGKSLRELASNAQRAKLAYHEFAVVIKDAVNDADKMDIVVKACQAEFIKLKLTTNNIKARLNAHRLKTARKGHAFREWAEMCHFETIECIRREMEEVEEEAAEWRLQHGEAWARAQAEWDALMSGNRRIKVAMMLKKMKNSRAACAFSTWSDAIQAIKFARAEAERQALLDEYQRRFAHLSKEQIEAKLREFIKRWQNAKKSPAFRSWCDMVAQAKAARSQAELDAELAAMRARLAQMQDNSMMAKLKLFFKKKLEGLKSCAFQALIVHSNQSKAKKLLEGEAGKRIKQFLKSKLASIGRQCWQAWLQHHDNIAAENIKNNENAKKVGIMLEKIARSLVHRCFNAFVRFQLVAAEERAAADALAERLAKMDDLYKAKLRVFLDAKRLGKMSTFYKHWANVIANRGANDLLAAIEHEEALIKQLNNRLSDAESALAGQGIHAAGLQRTLRDLEAAYNAEVAKHSSIQSDIALINRKAKDAEEMAAYERQSRKGILDEMSGLEGQLAAIRADCNELKGELEGIGAEVGYVHSESYN